MPRGGQQETLLRAYRLVYTQRRGVCLAHQCLWLQQSGQITGLIGEAVPTLWAF